MRGVRKSGDEPRPGVQAVLGSSPLIASEHAPARPAEGEDKFRLAKAGWETRALLFILIHLWGAVVFVVAAVGGAAMAAGEGTARDLL